MVVWKKMAKADQLVSRDTQQAQHFELWLDFLQTGAAPGATASPEGKLSRLTAWVLLADQQGFRYGLRLPTKEVPPDSGDAHKRACLAALALY
jgi:uncharacterized protein (DUF58 family)